MKAAWYRYEIDLGGPVRLGSAEARMRRGFILRLVDKGGRVGVGEAAPIDGYGRDSESEVHSSLAAAAALLEKTAVPSNIRDLEAFSAKRIRGFPPTIRYAAECALITLSAEASGRSPGIWLGGVRRPEVDVCALADADADSGSASVIKWKVGRGDPEAEGRDVADRLRRADGIRIRCDANRAWSPEQASAFLTGFIGGGGDVDRFEFVEEPLRETAGLAAFAASSPIPVALDETVLQAGSSFDPAAWEYIAYCVLKPALIGGLTESVALSRRILASGKHVVVSSAYESGVGLTAAAWLAAGIQGPAVGFGTAGRVANAAIPVAGALLANPIVVANLPTNPARGIDFDALEAIHE